jgi:hypothetical protein|tara:strand:+ start:1532 stop:1729 length:198 start_codon:yes stop_codon:yes gene_type:complete
MNNTINIFIVAISKLYKILLGIIGLSIYLAVSEAEYNSVVPTTTERSKDSADCCAAAPNAAPNDG